VIVIDRIAKPGNPLARTVSEESPNRADLPAAGWPRLADGEKDQRDIEHGGRSGGGPEPGRAQAERQHGQRKAGGGRLADRDPTRTAAPPLPLPSVPTNPLR